MQVTIIGCSGSFPSPESATSCYLLVYEDNFGKTWNIVLDLGNGALGNLQKHVSLDKIDAILVSHLHPDHYIDICGLHVARKYNPLKTVNKKIPVWAPKNISLCLTYAYGASDKAEIETEFLFHELTSKQEFKIGSLTITPYLVSHLNKTAFSFRIMEEKNGYKKIFTYSGDTDICENVLVAAQDSDLFLCEASYNNTQNNVTGVHLSGQRCGNLATAAKVKKLVVTHIPPWNDAVETLKQVQENYNGEIVLATPNGVHSV